MRMEEASAAAVSTLWSDLEPEIRAAPYLEEAAQAVARGVHETFGESVVLARLFLTVPYDALPRHPREFAASMARSAGAEEDVGPATPVLTLIGTHGDRESWNDRRRSECHVGIPLISSSFVDTIPMISRLLQELGVPLEWTDSHDAQVILSTMGRSAGLFYVQDAAEATDDAGRKIIAAQDFVYRHGVKGVFGTGGVYPAGQMIVLVVFCRDRFPREGAEAFLAMTNLFMSQTAELAHPSRVLSG